MSCQYPESVNNYYFESFTLYQRYALFMQSLRDDCVQRMDNYARSHFALQQNVRSSFDNVIAKEEGLSSAVNMNMPFFADHYHFNMMTYCYIKCKNYNKALDYLLRSFKNCPFVYNTAYGYIKYVLFIFNHVVIPSL